MSVLTPGQLSQAIAKALKDHEFRSSLLANPKATLASMDISMSDAQIVTVLESGHGKNFFVLPVMTDEDVKQLRASLDSALPQRAVRAKVLLEAWQNPNYKAQLIKNPETVLTGAGMKIPESTTITVLENSAEHLYLVLPALH